MKNKSPQIAVAGHICLDIIPPFVATEKKSSVPIKPGQLYLTSPVVHTTGGAVPNTGLALHRLGMSVTLMGKIADDLFGGEVLDILRRYHPNLANGMIVSRGENTSYSVVISPSNVDRSFLHCPGANDTFAADDVDLESLRGIDLFHFGYPPLMQRFYSDGGRQMHELFCRVKKLNVLTSLDMAMPDPQSEAGRIDWQQWLTKVLPLVDLFLPSIEETLFMLDRSEYDLHVQRTKDGEDYKYDVELLRYLANQLLDKGAKVVVLKLGEQGLYLRTSAAAAGLMVSHSNGRRLTSSWSDRELMAPCFQVEVEGTTGAGDSTIAGFLAAFASGASPEESLVQAVAVGACSVEVADATSGICSVSKIRKRIAAGWKQHAPSSALSGWNWDDKQRIYRATANARAE